MELKELLRKIKEKFTKEKLIGYWQWLWGKEPEPVDESILEDPDRYVKLDDENDDKYWIDVERYKKENTDLKVRRFFVCIFVAIFVLLAFKSILNFITYNKFINCFGKDMCIVKGPALNYPNYYIDALKLNNGDIFITTPENYNYAYNKYKKFLNPFLFIFSKTEFVSKIQKKLEEPSGNRVVEIYSSKSKKFKKVKDVIGINRINLVENSQNKILLISPFDNIDIFDLKSKKFIPVDVCNFMQENTFYLNVSEFCKVSNKPLHRMLYIDKYDNNRALVLSNNNHLTYPGMINGLENKQLTKPEHLYLFNLDNFKFEKLPDFSRPLKYYPISSDIKILKNGKIIIPIRTCKKATWFTCKPVWDHIEIYDPIQNKFFAEPNAAILADNIFDIQKENGDVLFINKNSSYIFKNATNTFQEADLQETIKNKNNIKQLEKLLLPMGIKLEEKRANTTKIIKIAPEKFIITCDVNAFSYCKETVYFDYENNIIKKGPKFLYPHYSSTVVQLEPNKFMFIGGHNGDLILLKYKELPNKYTQILILNK